MRFSKKYIENYTAYDSYAVDATIVDFSAAPDNGLVYLKRISTSSYNVDCNDTSLTFAQQIRKSTKINSPGLFLLIRKDKNGRKMWSRCLCDEAMFYADPEKWCSSIPNTVGRIISTNDNGFLISLHGAILKLDSIGNPQWNISFCKDSIPGISRDLLRIKSMGITDIKLCPNGNYVALISQSFSILLISKDGSPKWLKPTLPGEFGTKYFYLFRGGINSGEHLIDSLSFNAYETAPLTCEIHPTLDSGFIITGRLPFEEGSFRLISKRDSDFNKYKFFDPKNNNRIYPSSIILVKISSEKFRLDSNKLAFDAHRIIKVNKDGQLEWEKLSGSYVRNERLCYRIGIDKESNILLAYGVVFFKYNKDGDTLSVRKHPEGVTWIGRVTASSDNGYWAFGESYGPPFVAKLNHDGDIIWYKTFPMFWPNIDVKDAGDGGCFVGDWAGVRKIDSKGNIVKLKLEDLKGKN